MKNLSGNAAQDQADNRATEPAEDARRQWVEPEVVELDYEATEAGIAVTFDGTTYS